MRREQREKWRREINDEILPSLLMEQMSGDSDATLRQTLTPYDDRVIMWFISLAFSQHPEILRPFLQVNQANDGNMNSVDCAQLSGLHPNPRARMSGRAFPFQTWHSRAIRRVNLVNRSECAQYSGEDQKLSISRLLLLGVFLQSDLSSIVTRA
jgi:hypothetical protein